MALLETCPLCGEHNCFEMVDFTINGTQFKGVKCTKCRSMLYSAKKELEADIEAMKIRFDQLSKYPL